MQQKPIDQKKLEHTTPTELKPEQPPAPPETQVARRRRGFAAMNRDLVRDIARKGGKAAHAAGTAHEFNSEEARAAGRKGGQATHARRRERLEK